MGGGDPHTGRHGEAEVCLVGAEMTATRPKRARDQRYPWLLVTEAKQAPQPYLPRETELTLGARQGMVVELGGSVMAGPHVRTAGLRNRTSLPSGVLMSKTSIQ